MVPDFILKINVDSDCSHEIKRYLLLGRKAMTNLDNILKSRDIAFPTKVLIVKGFLIVSEADVFLAMKLKDTCSLEEKL